MNTNRIYDIRVSWAYYTALALVGLGSMIHFYVRYELMPFSDPALWFSIAREYPANFSDSSYAYLFPAMVRVAIAWVGLYPAFLVNIPILGLMLGAFYILCERLCRSSDSPTLISISMACVAMAGLFLMQGDVLREMVNPFRDPLAHVLALVAVIVWMRLDAGRVRVWHAIAGGMLLALASSTRESYVLLVPSFGLYLWAGYRFRFTRAFWIHAVAGAAAYLVAVSPSLVQNYRVTEHVLLSGQAIMALQEGRDSLPWLSLSYARIHAPDFVAYLLNNMGWPTLLLFAVGMVQAVHKRNRVVWTLLLPAGLLHAVLYISYHTLFDRYLFVLSFFVLPVAVYAAACFLHRLQARASNVLLCASLVCVLILLVWPGGTPAEERYRLKHARALVEAVDARVEPGTLVLADIPFAGLLDCFSDHQVTTQRAPQGQFSGGRWRAAVEAVGEAVYVGGYPRMYSYLQMLVDGELFDEVDTETLHLHHMKALGRRMGPSITFARLHPWSSQSVRLNLEAEPGKYVLMINPGILYPESTTRLQVHGDVVDAAVQDFTRYYPVEVPVSGQLTVELESDHPLPANMPHRLMPEGHAIHVDLHHRALPFVNDRLSPIWMRKGRVRPYPGLWPSESGTMRIPTPSTNRYYQVALPIDWQRHEMPAGQITVRINEHILFQSVVNLDHVRSLKSIAFGIPPELIQTPDTEVEWHVDTAPGKSRSTFLHVQEIIVKPVGVVTEWLLYPSLPESVFHLGHGFYAPDGVPVAATPRWTRGLAHVIIPPLNPLPEELVITYSDPLHAFRSDQAVYIALNGVPLDVHIEQKPDTRWVLRAEWPAWADRTAFYTLSLQNEALIPDKIGVGLDRRELGVMLHHIYAGPLKGNK